MFKNDPAIIGIVFCWMLLAIVKSCVAYFFGEEVCRSNDMLEHSITNLTSSKLGRKSVMLLMSWLGGLCGLISMGLSYGGFGAGTSSFVL